MITKRILNKAIKLKGNQSQLAAYMGFSRQMMTEIMKGRRPFPKAKIERLMELIPFSQRIK